MLPNFLWRGLLGNSISTCKPARWLSWPGIPEEKRRLETQLGWEAGDLKHQRSGAGKRNAVWPLASAFTSLSLKCLIWKMGMVIKAPEIPRREQAAWSLASHSSPLMGDIMTTIWANSAGFWRGWKNGGEESNPERTRSLGLNSRELETMVPSLPPPLHTHSERLHWRPSRQLQKRPRAPVRITR